MIAKTAAPSIPAIDDVISIKRGTRGGIRYRFLGRVFVPP